MKRLLYLLPIVLLALSATHISLYKDTVSYSPNGALLSLTPHHWKFKDYQASLDTKPGAFDAFKNLTFSSSDTSSTSSSSSNTGTTTNKPVPPVSQGAKFNGFPFGFYLVNNSSSSTSQATTGFHASAYSWLWGLVDGLLVAMAFLVIFLFNRRHGDGERMGSDSSLDSPQLPNQNFTQSPPPNNMASLPDSIYPSTTHNAYSAHEDSIPETPQALPPGSQN